MVYSNALAEHSAYVGEMLKLLQSAGVTLKTVKSSFFNISVFHLGHTIRPGQLEIDKQNLAAMKQAKPQSNRTKFSSFLGVWNIYRRVFSSFARIDSPLHKKTAKGEPFRL